MKYRLVEDPWSHFIPSVGFESDETGGILISGFDLEEVLHLIQYSSDLKQDTSWRF